MVGTCTLSVDPIVFEGGEASTGSMATHPTTDRIKANDDA
jgi:hypothetical protein